MKIRKAIVQDYKFFAVIHKTAFENFFLTLLGIDFLETYYKACIKYDDSIAICAVDEEDNILGFATGCLHANQYHKKLILKNLYSFAIRGLMLILCRPKALLRLAMNLNKTPNPKEDKEYSELLSIAILPELNGSGLGEVLLTNFENEAFSRGSKKVTLTTDYYDNNRVLSFYKKCGYGVFYDFITYPNRRMYKLLKYIDNKPIILGNNNTHLN